MTEKKRGPGRPREVIGEKKAPQRVMALRAKGMSFGQIAQRLGFSKTRAQQIHSRVLAEQNGGESFSGRRVWCVERDYRFYIAYPTWAKALDALRIFQPESKHHWRIRRGTFSPDVGGENGG